DSHGATAVQARHLHLVLAVDRADGPCGGRDARGIRVARENRLKRTDDPGPATALAVGFELHRLVEPADGVEAAAGEGYLTTVEDRVAAEPGPHDFLVELPWVVPCGGRDHLAAEGVRVEIVEDAPQPRDHLGRDLYAFYGTAFAVVEELLA